MAGFDGTQAAAVMDFWYSSPHAVHANHDPASNCRAALSIRPVRQQVASQVPNPGHPPTGKDFHDAKGCEALASHALSPKASRRNPRGCLKFGKVRGTPMQREPILLQNLSYPPGLRWDPLRRLVQCSIDACLAESCPLDDGRHRLARLA